MFEKIIKWIQEFGSSKQTTPARALHQPGAHPRPGQVPHDRHKSSDRRTNQDRRKEPQIVEPDSAISGKNVLIRNKYQREDTGTHETLKIIDESLLDSNDEAGIDPYNTGNFDRSRSWDKRYRK